MPQPFRYGAFLRAGIAAACLFLVAAFAPNAHAAADITTIIISGYIIMRAIITMAASGWRTIITALVSSSMSGPGRLSTILLRLSARCFGRRRQLY